MFTNLIDNLGISNLYDIDPSTNNIAPASSSKWYFFAIPLFPNENIPWIVLTQSNQCVIKVELDANKFILPTSPLTDYNYLQLDECKLIASQIFIPPKHYDDIVKNSLLEYRINDTQNSGKYTLDTITLINDSTMSVKVTSRQGGCSLFLIGLRERNDVLKFCSFIPINNVAIRRKDNSKVKNQAFNTDILRNINAFDHDTGEFFLIKELVAYSFDSAIDRVICMGHHGGVEVLEDEFYIQFEVPNKGTVLNINKSYELVVQMYQPRLLRVIPANSDVDIKF